jgi:large subunit ribosomal protein L7/L12
LLKAKTRNKNFKSTKEKKTKRRNKMSVESILESIEKLTLLEAAELVKAMEEKFGVSAAAPVAVAAAAPAAAGAAAGADDADAEVSVVLASVPADKKIAVLKEVRTITGLGLKEAKDLVEAAPKPVKENIKKAEAEEIKKTLEAAGGVVEIK